ncbi:MAG: AAA family ATPase, partial [Acidobacteria bacterium]|nr:AAA family ATPase [Acidobacteriota bacterium]
MARKIKKYNPGFLTDQELVDSFCVRTGEFGLLVETLRESTGNSNPHAIVIGPRGSGKTTLLLRVAAEVRRDPALQAAWFPVVFPEESYGVSTCGEFWLQCLFNLAQHAPRGTDAPDLNRTYEELSAVQDDRILGDLALAAILDFATTQGKRLVLLIENLNSLFNEIGDATVGWELRKTLQCEPRIFLLGSATSRFSEIDNADKALYDLFQVHTLKRLDTEACATLWRSVSERDIAPGTIRSLEILTGGNPRLLSIVAAFGSRLSFRELMDDLLDLVDDHTEYFRSHLEALGAQERRVYLALATLWQPSTASQVSAIARLSASHCSALLKRLVDRGEVIRSGGIPRRREYYLAERMYNIYHLLRSGRGTNQVVEALVRFMTAFYSQPELVNIFQGITAEASSAKGTTREMLDRVLKLLPTATSPAGEAEGFQAAFGLQAATSRVGVKERPAGGSDFRESRASELAAEVKDLLRSQEYEQVIAACNEINALLRGVGT